MPTLEPCPYCDGTGERDWLSGARCYECNGRGLIDLDADPDDEGWLEDDEAPAPPVR